MEFSCSFMLFWMIYCMVVAPLPYPGYKGCFPMHASQDDVFIWVLLLVWDSRKWKCIVWCPSSNWKASIVDAHVGTCHPSMWIILIFQIGFAHFIFSISDQDGGNSSLMTVVYHDGKSLLFCCWGSAKFRLGVIYYLYLFSRSCAGNECMNVIETCQSSRVWM